MGIAEQLDFRVLSPNVFQRGIQHVAASRMGSWLFSRTLHRADLVLLRASRGRASLPGAAAGLPVITLSTTGARSGLPRRSPVLGIPFGRDLAVIGSGWGMTATPAWVHNLLAHPTAQIGYRDRSVAALARRATPEEAERIWATARGIYPGYAVYPVRAAHREIVLFVLESAPQT